VPVLFLLPNPTNPTYIEFNEITMVTRNNDDDGSTEDPFTSSGKTKPQTQPSQPSQPSQLAQQAQKTRVIQITGWFGWYQELYDSRDKPYTPSQPGTIPTEIDLRTNYPSYSWFENVYDQYGTQGAVANATASAYRFVAWRSDKHLTDPSRLFLYYNARLLRYLDGKTKDITIRNEGCYIRTALKSLEKWGVCPESAWPWFPRTEDTQKDPWNWRVAGVNASPGDYTNASAPNYKLASNFRATEYYKLDPDRFPADGKKMWTDPEKKDIGIRTLKNLKQCLSEGYPVIFGVFFDGDPDLVPWADEAKRRGVQYLPDRVKWNDIMKQSSDSNGKLIQVAAHAVLAIGYSDKDKRVLCQNSWGKNWGIDRGFFWMSYNYILDWYATSDFWVIKTTVSIPDQQVKKPT
jgi:Papain family cysteine protease